MTVRQPYGPASDYAPRQTEPEAEPIPLMTPFQKYVLDALSGLGMEVADLKKSIDALVPRVNELDQRAAWWGKAVHYAKFVWPVLALEVARHLPALAKYVPIITDAIEKANP